MQNSSASIEQKTFSGGFSCFVYEGKYLVAGQPTEADLALLQEEFGPFLVINLRNPNEPKPGFDEELFLKKSGGGFQNIPIVQDGDFHKPSLQRAVAALSGLKEEEKALIHCAAGQRASLALTAFLMETGRISGDSAAKTAESLGLKKPELLFRMKAVLAS